MLNLLSYIYPVSFGICLLSLIMWFFFRGNRSLSHKMSMLFLGSFLIYLLTLAFSPASFSAKLFILFRDLMVIGLTSQFFNFFKTNKVVFFGLLAALIFVFKIGYFQYLKTSYLQGTLLPKDVIYGPAATSGLDPEGELLLELKEGQDINELNVLLKKYDLKFEKAFEEIAKPEITDLDNFYVLNVPGKYEGKVKKIVKEFEKTGLIGSIEENEVIKLEPLKAEKDPEEKINKRQYGVNDPGVENLWGFDKMELDKLYQYLRDNEVKPSKTALIAILDTGVDSKHEDIDANYRSISQKWNDDPHSHGTHCAGIAAAVSNNGKGIASYAPDNGFVQVTGVKVLNQYGMGTQRGIINGMLKAVDNGADVLSMSLGGPSDDKKQNAYNKAVKYANDRNAIVICAAGNENRNAKDRSPANTEGVIVVSAVDSDLNKASFSNEVHDLKMGIAAPGVNIYSTVPGNKYAFYNGTSMATPYIAGLVGLLKAINPDLDTREIYDILKDTGIKTGSDKQTGKFIQPAKAVEKALD